jgi:hypothetical protein
MTRMNRLIASLLLAAGIAAPAAAEAIDTVHVRVLGVVVVWGADGASPGAGAPVASDFVINTGNGATAATSGDTDLIAANTHTVVTGSLVPVSNGWNDSQGSPMVLRNLQGRPNLLTDTNTDGVMSDEDAFSAFRIRAASDTDIRRMEIWSSFYVASNIAFAIDGQATADPGTTLTDLQRIRLTLTTARTGNDGLAFGAASQFPHTSGAAGGSLATNRQLSTMVVPRRVFAGNRRTASGRGTLADQSVRFDLRYRYNFGATDLSEGVFDIGATVVYTVYVP